MERICDELPPRKALKYKAKEKRNVGRPKKKIRINKGVNYVVRMEMRH